VPLKVREIVKLIEADGWYLVMRYWLAGGDGDRCHRAAQLARPSRGYTADQSAAVPISLLWVGPASDGLSERWEGPGSGTTVDDSATVTCT
jgi:hypothetical protein